jgi:hypothetical protein
MANWVKCKSAADPDEVVYVNLDQAITIVETSIGSEITYAGPDCVFSVGNTPTAILDGETVRVV